MPGECDNEARDNGLSDNVTTVASGPACAVSPQIDLTTSVTSVNAGRGIGFDSRSDQFVKRTFLFGSLVKDLWSVL